MRARIALTLLSRRECPLCDELRAHLERWDDGRNVYALTVIDVETDVELERRFGLRIPVLMHRDAELCAGRFDATALNALLPAG
jgi:hypothetical protein